MADTDIFFFFFSFFISTTNWRKNPSNVVVVEVLKIFTIALTRLTMVSFNNFHVGHNSDVLFITIPDTSNQMVRIPCT